MKSPEYGGTFGERIGDFFATVRAGYLRWLTSDEEKLEEATATGVPTDGTPSRIEKLLKVVELLRLLKEVPLPDPEKREAARERLLNAAEKIKGTNRCHSTKKVA
jgi:hypothetical protein